MLQIYYQRIMGYVVALVSAKITDLHVSCRQERGIVKVDSRVKDGDEIAPTYPL
jgi:hypothetical protein